MQKNVATYTWGFRFIIYVLKISAIGGVIIMLLEALTFYGGLSEQWLLILSGVTFLTGFVFIARRSQVLRHIVHHFKRGY